MIPHIVLGLGAGDEGKGKVTAALTRENKHILVVRFNGGAQAAHNVVNDDGTHHTFHQFGSGTFEGAATLLSRFMLVNPWTLQKEFSELVGKTGKLQTMLVDKRAVVTLPWHIALNRQREIARGSYRHGSCGMGISETMQDSIERPDRVVRMGDIRHDRVLLRKLESSLMAAERKSVYVCGNHDMDSLAAAHDKAIDLEESRNVLLNNSARMINSAMEFLCSFGGWLSLVDEEEVGSVLRTSNPIFEGAQGVMLDEHFGHYPHVTWSDTTDRNAVSLLHEAGIMDYHCVGVTRKYGTRHGPGPLFDDDPQFPAKDVHNVTGKWQGRMRYGNLNYAELRRAIQCCKRVDSVAVTHADASGPTPNSVAENLSRPLKLISHGPKTCDTMFPANVEV